MRQHELETILSPREQTVLALIAQGLTNARVAQVLGVSTHAVKFHVASIYRKLGVANRTEAAGLFLRAQASSEMIRQRDAG